MDTRLYPQSKKGVKGKYNSSGVLDFFDNSGNIIYSIDPANRKLSVPSGSEFSSVGKVNLAAATQTLTAAQSGQTFVGAVDAVFTLPAASSSLAGVWYRFITGALSAGTGLSVSPAAADNIYGAVTDDTSALSVAITAADDKDLINTGATDVVGDRIEVVCDGTNWLITDVHGIWAREA